MNAVRKLTFGRVFRYGYYLGWECSRLLCHHYFCIPPAGEGGGRWGVCVCGGGGVHVHLCVRASVCSQALGVGGAGWLLSMF